MGLGVWLQRFRIAIVARDETRTEATAALLRRGKSAESGYGGNG